MKRIISLAGVLLLLSSAVYGLEYDSIDDLFSDNTDGIVEEDEVSEAEAAGGQTAAASPRVNIDEQTTRPLRIGGSVKLEGGAIYGLTDWPSSIEGTELTLDDITTGNVLYDMSASLSVDARPAPHLRFRMATSSSLNTTTLKYSDFGSIQEMFVDYTYADNYFFRAGKHSTTWGQGRLLGNPGNIVSDSGAGVALRAFIPFGPGGVNALVFAQEKFFLNTGQPSPRELVYAAQYDLSRGNFTVGVSGRYQHMYKSVRIFETRSAMYVKSSFAGMDLTLEGVSHFNAKDPVIKPESPVVPVLEEPKYWVIGNLFYEFGSPKWQLIAEYQYNHNMDPEPGHLAALGIKTPRFLGWNYGLSWKHLFNDQSGELVPGMERTIAPNIKATIGLPITYGEEDSYFRSVSNVPGNRVAALVAVIGLSFSF